MIWGYGGVWAGDYEIWKSEDQTLARLEFIVGQGFHSASAPLAEMRDPARRDLLAAFVAQHDLQLTVHAYPKWFRQDADEIKRETDAFVRDLEAYGELLRVPIVTTGAGPVHRFMADPSLEAQLDHLAASLAPLARACQDLGRPLGIENHGDYYCSDLVGLCRRVPGLGIFLDTGNGYLIGEKPVPAAREAAPHTIGTHFKDHVVNPAPGPLRFEIHGAVLGQGHVGLREIYEILVAHAPRVDKLVMHWELVPPKDMNALDALDQSWAFVRSLPQVEEEVEAGS